MYKDYKPPKITKENALWKSDMVQLLTPELKEIIGDFENKYNSRKTGKIIATFNQGHFDEGILNWLIEKKALIKREWQGIENYYVITNRFDMFKRKYNALEELRSRREFARNAELENYDKNLLEQQIEKTRLKLEIEEKEEAKNRTEFIPDRELKNGEIDVNKLPL